MPITKVKMVEARCDGCEKVDHWPEEEPPHGIHLSWTEVSGAGADGGTLFACSERCVPKAFKRRQEIKDRQEGRL